MALFVQSESMNSEFASLQSPAAMLDDLQQACSIQEALDMARKAILDYHCTNMEVTDQCAMGIAIIWEYIQARKTSEPQNSRLIEQWTHDMTQEISETAIVKYQSLAASTRRRIARYESRIRTNWGIVPTQILPARHFDARKSLSKECLGNLAQLSGHVSLQAGRELLLEQIRARTIAKNQRLKVTDSHLKPRDVVITLEALAVKNNMGGEAPLKPMRDGLDEATSSQAHNMEFDQGRTDLDIRQSHTSSDPNDASASTPLEPNAPTAPDFTHGPRRNVTLRKRKMSGKFPYSRPKNKKKNIPMEALEYGDEDLPSPEIGRHMLPKADNFDDAQEPFSAGSSPGTTTAHTQTQNSSTSHTHTRKLFPTALLPLSAPKQPKKRRRRRKPASDFEFTDEGGGGDSSQASLRSSLVGEGIEPRAASTSVKAQCEITESPPIELGRSQPHDQNDSVSFDSIGDLTSNHGRSQHVPSQSQHDADHAASPTSGLDYPLSPPGDTFLPEVDETVNLRLSLQRGLPQLSTARRNTKSKEVVFLQTGELLEDSSSIDCTHTMEVPMNEQQRRTSSVPSKQSDDLEASLEKSRELLGSDQKLPKTNNEGALASLQPGKWVSDTALELILHTINPDDCAIIESRWATTDKIGAVVAKHAKKMARLWLPIMRMSHWMFMVVNYVERIVEVYGSSAGHQKTITELYNAVISSLDGEWTRKDHEMPRHNGYDCGVHVLIAALCSITQTALPMEVPSLPWRRILSMFLDPGTEAENLRQQEQDAAPPSLQGSELGGDALESSYRSVLTLRERKSLAHQTFNILHTAAAIVQKQRADLSRRLGGELAALESQYRMYDGLTEYLAPYDGNVVGLSDVQLGISNGRERLDVKLAQLRCQQASAERSRTRWDAVLLDSRTSLADVAHRLPSAENALRQVFQAIQEDINRQKKAIQRTECLLGRVTALGLRGCNVP
ncbi:MAG: hypothetical protein Q9219_005298 [cf. Caloplaca sp. 3 TL-2023]